MSGRLDKLAALGDALNVGDDTQTIERPDRTPPRGVRQALAASDSTTLGPASAVPDRSVGPTRHVTSTARIRSTVNLPLGLSQRITAARQQRWELSDLLSAALHHSPPTAGDADRVLLSLRHELWVQRHYRLDVADRDILDNVAEQWRMNRSQAIAVLLTTDLDRLAGLVRPRLADDD